MVLAVRVHAGPVSIGWPERPGRSSSGWTVMAGEPGSRIPPRRLTVRVTGPAGGPCWTRPRRQGWNLLETLPAPPDGPMNRIAKPESAPVR